MRYTLREKRARNEAVIKYNLDNPGLSLGEMSKKFGISRARVWQILNPHGLEVAERKQASYCPISDGQRHREIIKPGEQGLLRRIFGKSQEKERIVSICASCLEVATVTPIRIGYDAESAAKSGQVYLCEKCVRKEKKEVDNEQANIS